MIPFRVMRILLLGFLLGLPLYASEVSFLAIGYPSMLKIHAHCDKSEAKVQVRQCEGAPCNKLTASVDLDSCDTGIDMRNRHMKEKYLQTAQFPKANLEAFIPSGDGDFKGAIQIHGNTKPVSGKVEGGVIKFKLKISDFGIDIPSFMGVVVADVVEIEAKL